MKQASLVSRRTLIAGIVIGGVAASGYAARQIMRTTRLESFFAPVRRAPRLIDLAHAEIDQWRAMAGRTFNVSGFLLQLTGVEPLPGSGIRPRHLRQQGFLAVFDALGGQTLPSDLIFSISNPQSTAFTIFLTGARDPTRPGRMHAVFN